MPNISRITLPSGTVYDIKDAQARADIETIRNAVSSGVTFLGVTTTELTDGASTSIINIEGVDRGAINGGIAIYGSNEFIWADIDSKWHMLGAADEFGALAYKASATGNFTPAGTVSQPTFSGTEFQSTGTFTPTGNVAAPTITVETAGATSTIKNPTAQTVAKTVVAAAPGAEAPANALTYYAVNEETLSLYQLGYTTGDSITTANVTVKTGDAAYSASAPAFIGSEGTVTVAGTATGTVSQPTFTGTQGTVTVS